MRNDKYTHLLEIIFGGVDLADMQLMSKYNKRIRILCAIDFYSKYAWVVLLKRQKGITITNSIQKFLDKSNPKFNKIWVDKGSKFNNRSLELWLQDNDIKIYSTHNEEKSVLLLLKHLLEP